jgi:hypothetical protein
LSLHASQFCLNLLNDRETGPFAYDGLISFWFAVFVFFGWMSVMTVTTFRVITAESRRQA